MVRGLAIFQQWFQDFEDQYVLIGGTAASITMTEAGFKDMDMGAAESNLKTTEAIINSMTRKERHMPDILNASRRRRIAAAVRANRPGRRSSGSSRSCCPRSPLRRPGLSRTAATWWRHPT